MFKNTIKIITGTLILSMILLPTGCAKDVVNQNRDNTNNTNENYSDKNRDVSEEDIKLLNNLKEYAKNGMINEYEFKIGDTIDSVYKIWGTEDKIDYVAKAKGTYSTYNKQNAVFGCNKGAQIFEIRSYDESLKSINLSAIKKVYGEPQHNIINSQNQRVVGYKINEDFKIEFVLINPTEKDNEQFVDHYGVLCPKLTVNNMADDPGREW